MVMTLLCFCFLLFSPFVWALPLEDSVVNLLDDLQTVNETNKISCGETETAPLYNCRASNIPLFQQTEPLEMELHVDDYAGLKQPVDKLYQKGQLIYKADESDVKLQIELTGRGANRAGACNLKPLKIQFLDDKATRKNTIFKKSDDDLKFVTHCMDSNSEEHMKESNVKVLQEYQRYLSLQALGVPSLNARLTKTKYIEKGVVKREAYGIILESKKDLAQRCEMEVVDKLKGNHRIRSKDRDDLISLFLSEHFLLNMDYDEKGRHNTILLKGKKNKLVVPYDFDLASMSGMYDDKKSLTEFIQTGSMKVGYATGVYGIGKTGKQAEWEASVKAHLKRMVDNKESVYKALQSTPLDENSKQLFKIRYDSFFKAAQELL